MDETTLHRQQNLRQLQLHGPQSYFRVPSGLGQGLGMSLGIKLAAPERPVVSLIGDGALLYNPVTQSLGLAKAANLPLLIVVYNNDGGGVRSLSMATSKTAASSMAESIAFFD